MADQPNVSMADLPEAFHRTPSDFADFAPMAERAAAIEAAAMVRLRATAGRISGFIRLPYEVVAGRTIEFRSEASFDVTVAAADLLAWLDGGGPLPARRDAHWLSSLPPLTGWQRVDSVPDTVIRDLIRSGAQLADRAATRPEQQALVETRVLSLAAGGRTAEVPLGALSGLTRMGFLPRGSVAWVDVRGSWTRVAARYGSTFVSRAALPLGLLDLGG